MPSKIARRIIAQAGMPGLDSVLAGQLSAADLQSLLLEVYGSRVARIRESDLVSRSLRSPLLAPSSADARAMNRLDGIAFAEAPEFEAIDLSPVCALGLSSVLGRIHQNNVLTTIRNAEVLGDSTPALAMEAVRRRRHSRGEPVRVCSSHRVVRLQPFDFPGFTPHFRLFALVSAGRDKGASRFEIHELRTHIRFYLKLFRALNAEGVCLTDPLVEVSDLAATEALLKAAGVSRDDVRKNVRAHLPGSSGRFLAERGIQLPSDIADVLSQWRHLSPFKESVFDTLATEFPEARFRFNLARLEGLGYYDGLCLRISPVAPDGVRYPVADGGFTDWTARLLQDRKERLLISGIGSEFVCRRYLAVAKRKSAAHDPPE
ncbi:MAG TPA: hypothetical protein VH639_09870 [Bryobacteraceae bacterium]|jgi:hypothetical protein